MQRAISVIEMLRKIERKSGGSLHLNYRETRPGDQPLYVSDTSKLQRHTGWRPSRSLDHIFDDIHRFWLHSRDAITTNAMPSRQIHPQLVAQEVA
jgi:CDP-paratose 2-epimerase